ncbi:uncharacterized protein LOC117330078 [Pecten maximus]|uniref:uncharacterized protein LOC117330078 n=1 Tax=Pecten maximus TaxID=6579 RepID=UPI001458C6A7|nr:uncharacterized protein LOC117330078 [Pecten maximus]
MASRAPEVNQLEELKQVLMRHPDYLGNRNVKKIWDDLGKCVSKKKDVGGAFENLEKEIVNVYHIKRGILQKRKEYSKLKKSIVAACQIDNGGHHSAALKVEGKTQIQEQKARVSGGASPKKDDSSASNACARLCKLIECLYRSVTSKTDLQLPDTKDMRLNEEHTLMYNEAQRLILKIRDNTMLTRNQELKTVPTAMTLHNKIEDPSTDRDTHSVPSYSGQGESTPNHQPTDANERTFRDDMEKKMKERLEQQNMKFQEATQKLKQEIHILKEEKDQLLTRMSKMAGDKLTRNNPGIADLSDPNRPQKLAEKYGELYDNEWTDAIDKLNPKRDDKVERQCIDVLAGILKFCYSACEQVADNQFSQLQQDCFILPKPGRLQVNTQDAPESAKQNLLEAQYSASIFTTEAAVNIVTANLLKERQFKDKAKQIPLFTARCIEICWSMVTHKPRLILLWPDQSKNSKIDPNMFQSFTISGDILDFVVWPAMLSYMDGPLLRKGTAQPVAKQATQGKYHKMGDNHVCLILAGENVTEWKIIMQERQVKPNNKNLHARMDKISQQGDITDYIKQTDRTRYTSYRRGWVLDTTYGFNSTNHARENNGKVDGTTTSTSTTREHARRPHTVHATYRPIEKKKTGYLEQKMFDLERQLQDTRAKLRQAEEDRNYWINRMSKVTDGQSDPMPPSQLAEQYSQLYDKEWMDAMLILTETKKTTLSERSGIDILITILQRSHEMCQQTADEQMNELIDIVMLQPNMEKSSVRCPIEVRRNLQVAQQQASKRTLPAVQKKLHLRLESLMETFGEFPKDRLKPFVDKCTEICWGMVMQSPRVEFLIPERGVKFNKDHFKEFKQSGVTVEYVVWPAMIAHKQGSLLVKGIIQPVVVKP